VECRSLRWIKTTDDAELVVGQVGGTVSRGRASPKVEPCRQGCTPGQAQSAQLQPRRPAWFITEKSIWIPVRGWRPQTPSVCGSVFRAPPGFISIVLVHGSTDRPPDAGS